MKSKAVSFFLDAIPIYIFDTPRQDKFQLEIKRALHSDCFLAANTNNALNKMNAL